MLDFIHYTCKAELLPMVEGVLAANGYLIELSQQQRSSGATTLVMRSGATEVLLEHSPNSAIGEIEVWGTGQSATVNLLESQPIELHKQPLLPLVAWAAELVRNTATNDWPTST
jgi:hypothetical protein